jgi:hypothetical protein
MCTVKICFDAHNHAQSRSLGVIVSLLEIEWKEFQMYPEYLIIFVWLVICRFCILVRLDLIVCEKQGIMPVVICCRLIAL